jgi:hypothetical protein
MIGFDKRNEASEGTAFYPHCRAILHLIFEGFGDAAQDSDEFIVPVLPKAATIHRNKYSQADSFELTFAAADLPIDPDLVRAGSAEIYLFQTLELDEMPRVLSVQRAEPGGPLESVARMLGVSSAVKRWVHGNDPIIVGILDEDRMDLSPSGKWVTISGQDYTALLASRQWPPTPKGRAQRIPTGAPLDVIMGDVLAMADPTGKLELHVDLPEEDPIPWVRNTGLHGRGIPVEQDTSYWDVLYKLAVRHGLICYVDGLRVVLTKPRNIDDLGDWRIRRLAWGRNIESLNLARKMGKEEVPTIIVQGYDKHTRQPIYAEYPPRSKQIDSDYAKAQSGTHERVSTTERHKAAAKTPPKKPSKGKKTTTISKQDEYQFVPAYGEVSDLATLQRMAESMFHVLGRSERTAVLKTKALRDANGTNMLNLTAGDAVIIWFDDIDAEMLLNEKVVYEEKVRHLIGRGYSDHMAAVVATHYRKLAALQRPLRVREATYTWDVESGLDIELELVNFIMIEREVHATAEERREARLEKAEGGRLGYGRSTAEEKARLVPGRRAP